MKTKLLSLFLLFLSILSFAQNTKDIQKEVPELVKFYKHLHQHPELSFVEYNTSKLLAQKMRQLGFKITENFGGTGIVAIMKNGKGPKILIRTDMDALPILEKTGLDYASKVKQKNVEGIIQPVMHACGHDMHMTVWYGTAKYLATHKNEWKGTIMMIGQPAEERGGGSKAMLDAGLYKKFFVPDYALALHVNSGLPAGKISYCPGFAMANVDMARMTIKGQGGHGAYPHLTIDPVVMSAYYITELQTIVSREVSPIDAAVVTVGSIHGGTKGNIIPSEVNLEFTIRSYKDEVRNKVLKAMQRKANAVAMSFNVPKEDYPVLKLKDTYTPALYNDPVLTQKIVKVFEKTFGKENVIIKDPVMGGEDFGRFGRTKEKVPIMMFFLGAVNPEKYEQYKKEGKRLPSLHNNKVVLDPAKTAETGVKAFVSAIEFLTKKN